MDTGVRVRDDGLGDALRLDTVMNLAIQECCDFVYKSWTSHRASFKKFDVNCNSYMRINVYCAESIVGICLDHPRQGKMEVFCRGVDMSMMRDIFRSPRTCARYCEFKTPDQKKASPVYAIGDRVHVNWRTISDDATVIDIDPKDVKVIFSDGVSVRINPSQLTKIGPDPKPRNVPKGECLSLESALRLQLKRLDREIESIEREKVEVLKLQDDTRQNPERIDRLSPTSVASKFHTQTGRIVAMGTSDTFASCAQIRPQQSLGLWNPTQLTQRHGSVDSHRRLSPKSAATNLQSKRVPADTIGTDTASMSIQVIESLQLDVDPLDLTNSARSHDYGRIVPPSQTGTVFNPRAQKGSAPALETNGAFTSRHLPYPGPSPWNLTEAPQSCYCAKTGSALQINAAFVDNAQMEFELDPGPTNLTCPVQNDTHVNIFPLRKW